MTTAPMSVDKGGKGGDGAGVNRVRFTLPELPGSVNSIYGPETTIYSPTPEWTIKAPWRLWRSNMGVHIPRFTVAPRSIIRVDRSYFYWWWYLNGEFKVADVTNLDKLLYDTIAKKIRVNDLFFKDGELLSFPSRRQEVEVMLTEIPEDDWLARADPIDRTEICALMEKADVEREKVRAKGKRK